MTQAVEYQADSDWRGMVSYTPGATLTAAGIPVKPPKQWFDNPQFDRLSPLTVTADGQVYGHVASWSSSHIGRLGKVRPPRSRSNYAYFRTGEVETDDGSMVPVGQITLTGGHAPLEATAAAAVAHYDNTHSAIMDVAAGEDGYGIWVAGALRPDVDDVKIRAIRASSFSGDWRPVENSLELVAICAVNVPGFPIPRALAASADEHRSEAPQILALVAAGTEELVTMARRDPLLAAAEYVIEDLESKIDWLKTALTSMTTEEPLMAAVAIEEQVGEATGEVSEGVEMPADGTMSELVIEPDPEPEAEPEPEPAPEPEPVVEEPVVEDEPGESDDDGESDSTMAEAAEEIAEFAFAADLSPEALAQEIQTATRAEILWADNLPLQFSAAQAEAVAVRLKFRRSPAAVDASLRAKAAEDGTALPDGRFPLRDVEDITKALQIVPENSSYYPHIETRAAALGIEDLSVLRQDALVAAATKQKYTFGERLKMSKTGEALVGGAFPIKDEDDLKAAVSSFARATDPAAAKSHIMKRARALRLVDALPEKWSA